MGSQMRLASLPWVRVLVISLGVLLVSACSSSSSRPSGQSHSSVVAAAKAKTESRYAIKQDLGPQVHKDMSKTPDAVPKIEAKTRGGNKSRYEVWGKQYSVMPSSVGFTQRGLASWYGQKFHGHLTSNGETYDMYAMSAAHKSLPLPTYARITNLDNNKVVIVRVNDRGPFHGNRIIDLSYAAASKLDYRKTGVANVLVEAIDPRSWTPAMEQSIRKQRNLTGYAGSGKAATKVLTKSVTKPLTKAAAPQSTPKSVGDEIRQQRARVPGYYVQVAAVSRLSSGMLLRNTLAQSLRRGNVFVEQASDRADLYRVLIGPLADESSGILLIQKVAQEGHGTGIIIRP